jgi:predicted permease
MLSDLRYALRALRRTPGFTAVVVLTLALGIGANSVMFSVIDAVLLRPLPYRDPASLVSVYEARSGSSDARAPVASGNYRDWRDRNRVFDAAALYRPRSMNFTGTGEPERLDVTLASANLFTVLGVAPEIGRPFTAAEDGAGDALTALISHRLWETRFGSDPGAVGRAVTLGGRSYTVGGVMPASFKFPNAGVDAWLPLALGEDAWSDRGAHNYNVVARLKPGVTLERARAEMRAIAARVAAENPDIQREWTASVYSLSGELAGGARPVLLVLAGAVGFVLLIACANVANLYLARAASRSREIAIRTAIGAGARHVVRQLLVESVLLASLGGAAGLLVAAWGARAVNVLRPAGLPRAEEVAVDGRVLLFTAGLSLLTGVLFGLVPALQAARPDLAEVMKQGAKGTSGGPGRARTRSALLVAEVAFSLVLLVGAGLMLKSFARLHDVNPGFATERLLTARVTLPPTKYDSTAKKAAFADALLPRLRALPGVRGAAVVSSVPLTGQNAQYGYWIDGRPPATASDVPVAVVRSATADYFRAMQIPLRRGRFYEDRPGGPREAVVSEALARAHFPGEDPIGKRVHPARPDAEPVEIVGVVADTKHLALDESAPPQMFLANSHGAETFGAFSVVVRAAGDPMALAGALRREVRAIDRDLPLADLRTMDEVIDRGTARQRLSSGLLAGFAGLALLLASVGIYGVIAYASAQRAREFGVRIALGANDRHVLRDVLGGALRLTTLGVALGLAASLALTRVLQSQLYEVSPTDPAVLAGISLLLTAVALVASYLPARRATAVDPITALRAE